MNRHAKHVVVPAPSAMAFLLCLALPCLPVRAQAGGAGGTTGLRGLRHVDHPPVISLDEAFRLAASKSTDLRIAATQVQAARANITKAWALLLPNVSAGSNLTFNFPEQTAAFGSAEQAQQQALLFNSIADLTEQSAALNPDPVQRRAALERAEALRKSANDIANADVPEFVIQPGRVLDGNVTVVLPLFNGRAIPLLQNAYGAVELTKLLTQQARAAVLWGTAQAYLQAVAAKNIVAIADEQVAAAQRHHAIAQRRFEQGMLTALTLERSQLEVAKAEQQAKQARAAQRMAKSALAALLGRVEDFDVVAPPPIAAIEDGAPFDALLQRAYAQRVDLRAQREATLLAERARTEAWMRFLPSFQLVAQGRYTSNTSGLVSEPFTGAVIVQGTLPIYDGGMTLGTIDEADAKLDAELLKVRQIEEDIERELRGTLDDLALKKDNVATTSSLAALAHKQAENAEGLFSEGVATDTDVRDARLGRFAADVDATRAALDLQLARLGLAYALGELGALVGVDDVQTAPVTPEDRDAARTLLDRVP